MSKETKGNTGLRTFSTDISDGKVRYPNYRHLSWFVPSFYKPFFRQK